MNSDIGDLGEADFDRLCTSANLVATRPKKDQYGWDYLVEFPPKTIPSLTLDAQPSPIKCMVQVKSTKKNRGSVQIKLSAMLGLVHAQMPSFICFMIYDGTKILQDVYLVHVDEKIITDVLKSARRCELQKKSPHKVKISIHYQDKDKLKLSNGQNLKDAISSVVSMGMDEYIKRKNELIQSVGFDNASYSIQTAFRGATENDILDLLLGVKKNLPVEVTQMKQKRFGIELPLENELTKADNVKVSVIVEPENKVLLIKESKYAKPLEFKVKAYMSHLFHKDKMKILLKNDILEIMWDFLAGEHTFKFSFKPKMRYVLKEMYDVLKLVDIANQNNEKPLIMSVKGSDIEVPFTPTEVKENALFQMYSIVNKLIKIYAKLEFDSGTDITIEDLWNNSSHIEIIFQFLYGNLLEVFIENKDFDFAKLKSNKSVYVLPFSFVIGTNIMGAFIVLMCNIEKLDNSEYKLIPYNKRIRNTFIAEYKNFDMNFYDEIYQNIRDELGEDIQIFATTKKYVVGYNEKII